MFRQWKRPDLKRGAVGLCRLSNGTVGYLYIDDKEQRVRRSNDGWRDEVYWLGKDAALKRN
jgi:hypothetical protein